MTTLLRRLLGVVLILAGAAALVVGGWFARALGTDGSATFTTSPPPGVPVVIDAQTNARTDIPLLITATAADDVPITASIASPSDAKAFLGESRYERVTGIGVRDWVLTTRSLGSGEPVAPAAADLWRSQVTTDSAVEIGGDLEAAPETMILTTPPDTELRTISMTWSNPAWFYQALALAFGGLLAVLVGLGLTFRRSASGQGEQPAAEPKPTPAPSTTSTEEVIR